MNKHEILIGVTASLSMKNNQFGEIKLASHPYNSKKHTVIYGEIYDDVQSRFVDGSKITTSNVKRIVLVDEKVYAITGSESVYLLDINEQEADAMCRECTSFDISLEKL